MSKKHAIFELVQVYIKLFFSDSRFVISATCVGNSNLFGIFIVVVAFVFIHLIY